MYHQAPRIKMLSASVRGCSVCVFQGTPEQRKLVAEILAAKDYYAILGLPRDATDDDIKKAYRKVWQRGLPRCLGPLIIQL